MKIFLVGNKTLNKKLVKLRAPYMLVSFYDMRTYEDELIKKILSTSEMFLLDSGAFSFIRGKTVDWEEYFESYVEFIKKWNVEYFFEIDLDTVIGVEETRKMTERLERETGRQCIPVFHACRGMQRWREMCKDYDYVAIAASRITDESKWTTNQQVLQQLVRIAHSHGTKVHGLGYTRLDNLNNTTVPFDTVDSKAVLAGEMYATVYKFANGKLYHSHLRGRSPGYKTLDEINMNAWIEMCRYKARDDL